MVAEEDDPLRTETPGCEHAAQPDGAVPDDRNGLAGPDFGADRAMVSGRHHVREREQRRHQSVVLLDREDDERPVGLRNTHRLALAAVGVDAVPTAVKARGVQPFLTELAGSVRPDEGRDDEVADLHRADGSSDVLDDADELVPHSSAFLGGLQ